MARHYQCISADSHLDIRPERWTDRVSKRWRERAPRTVTLANGDEGILVENRAPRSPGATTITGIPYEQHGLQKYWFVGPGTGASEQRLWEQDQDGVDAEVLFTHGSYPMFWRGISDDEAYKAVIRAYNEWLAEEYCAYSPHRLIAMGVIPDTGVNDAVEEMEYCAKAGLKGVNLHRFPSGRSYVVPDDDRFWDAAMDLKMPIASHTFGGTTRLGNKGPIFMYPGNSVSPDRARSGLVTVSLRRGAAHGAVADGHGRGPSTGGRSCRSTGPRARPAGSRTATTRSTTTTNAIVTGASGDFGIKPTARRPSEYLRENCLWGFMRDPWAVKCREEIGVDILLWGSDFAHATGNWPHSRDVIDETFVGAAEEERHAMLASNAIEFFHLDAALDLEREAGAVAKETGT